jgi:NAD/NADP transhydrogenase alpha subunit
MRVGLPKEIKPGEHRVGLPPTAVREYVGHGHEVLVEAGAGAGAGYVDEVYRRAGAQIGSRPGTSSSPICISPPIPPRPRACWLRAAPPSPMRR